MSAEAKVWARYVDGVGKHLVSTLDTLADLADEHGKGARPTQEFLAFCTRKTPRAARADLAALEDAGFIRKGDQLMVAHLPPDRRPIVWDLAMELPRRKAPRSAPSGRAFTPDRPEADFRPVPEPGGSTLPPGPDRGEADFRPVGETGGKPTSGRSADRGEADDRAEAHFRPANAEETGHTSHRAEADFLHKKEKEEEKKTPPPPTPETESRGDAAPADLTEDEAALVAEVCALRPDWAPRSVRTVVADPVIRERTDRALVRLAFLIAAEDRRSTTPKRLLHDHCPAWRKALAELYPAADRPDPGHIPVALLGARTWCKDDGCDEVTRILVDPTSGHPLPGRRRCPRCHPQSPAPGGTP